MTDKYVIYYNANATVHEFPYTVNGFVDAIDKMGELDHKKEFRLDLLRIINPNRVDLGCPDGLSQQEREILNTLA